MNQSLKRLEAQGAIAQIAEALKPLGIERSAIGGPGPDVGPPPSHPVGLARR